MKRAGAGVQIIVARSEESTAPDPALALRRLGPDARIEILHSAAACRARCRDGSVDLIVAEAALGAECWKLVEEFGPQGPPVIVVNRDGDEHAALEAFKRGAADCVVAGEEFADVLPVVALEQIQRWRAARDQGVAERRIRDLESYNQNIIQNLNSALLVVDMGGRIAFSNPPAEEILGESAEALRGRLIWPWFPDVPREEIHVARTLETGERFKGLESTLTRADGTQVPIGISSAPVTDGAGNKLGAVAVFSDLTEIKLLQRKVLQTEKMASIGQLAAGVAHEINNPMGFIHANLFQMAEYLADLGRVWDEVGALQAAVAGGDLVDIQRSSGDLAAVSKEVNADFVLSDFAKAIRESQEGSERIRHIVNDLRNFSHRDSEHPVLADVNQFLESTLGIVWPMMKHLVVLEKEYRDLPRITCYPMQLQQVFMNLLVNAYQAIEEQIGDSGDTGAIWLRTEPRAGGVAIIVRDSGVGIAAENLDRIFDPFFTTKKVGMGTGLGLSTCFNIVERHGGSLVAESKPGVETTFTVWLPGAEPERDTD
ncbi:MAG: PAS domain S-box protein [Myxococcales bacterium]|nr:PAS domain S-box protein [Myxococcales bacterium]